MRVQIRLKFFDASQCNRSRDKRELETYLGTRIPIILPDHHILYTPGMIK